MRAEAFGESHHAVTVGAEAPPPLDIVIHPAGFAKKSRSRRRAGPSRTSACAGQPVNVIDESEIASRVKTVVAQAVEGEAGVHLQRTSPTMAGIFVRGLTGNKVNIFVDGVRYSNGAQRGGVNTFLDLIEPEWLETIEVLRGPSSAQYGSDALGGSVQFLSRAPALGVAGGPQWRGSLGVDGGTAHRNGGGNAFVAYMGKAVGLTASLGGTQGRASSARARGSIRTRRSRASSASRRRAHGRAPAGHRVRAVRRVGAIELGPEREDAHRPPATCGRTRTAASATTSSSAATAT